MTTRSYIIYDQEPVKRLLDVPVAFIILLPLFFIIFKVLFTLSVNSKVFIYIIAILFIVALHIVTSLWSKYVSSNKLNIELTPEYLEISFLRKSTKRDKLRINLKEIIKTEGKATKFGISDHFKIYYGDNKIFAISKSAHLFIVRDNLENLIKDLDDELKNNK